MKTVQEVVESAASVLRRRRPRAHPRCPTTSRFRRAAARPLAGRSAGPGSAARWTSSGRRRSPTSAPTGSTTTSSRARTIGSGSSPAGRRSATRGRRSPISVWTTTSCRRLGIRVHKVGVVWPLEPDSVRAFARGCARSSSSRRSGPIIEQQLKDELYHLRAHAAAAAYPGKYDAAGRRRRWPSQAGRLAVASEGGPDARDHRQGDRAPAEAAGHSRRHRRAHGCAHRGHRGKGTRARAPSMRATPSACRGSARAARTTRARACPKGSRATAGIGCHGMVVWMDRSTTSWTQMGGEGVPWVGQAPFSARDAHVRQPRRRHVQPLRIARGAAVHRRRRQHHLQDPVQQRGRDDRRAAGRRSPRHSGADPRARGRRARSESWSSPTSRRSSSRRPVSRPA